MSIRIELYDTTLRDGAQAEGVAFSLNDKLAATARLDEMGFDYVEGGYPASNEKDKSYFESVAERSLKHARVCAFGMTRRRGVAVQDDAGVSALLDAKTEITTIVGKASLFQASQALRVSGDENLSMIEETIRRLVESGKRVFFDAEHFFDGWKQDAAYSLEALKVAVSAGAEAVVLCDTNGGSMPEEIAKGMDAVRGALSCVSSAIPVKVGIHTHNDCGLAIANSIAAVESGATIVQGTINGLGER